MKNKLSPSAGLIVSDIAAELLKVEIATNASLRELVNDRVLDAFRGRPGAQDWLLSEEGKLWVIAIGRYLEEGGKIR